MDEQRDAAQCAALRAVDEEEVPRWARAITDAPLTSLHDCLPAMRDEARARMPSASLPELPPFLYRGESGLYPETRSSLARLARDPVMSSRGLEQIMEITEAARAFLVQNWRFSELEASGFLQHYGLPTDWLDLTDDLSVAASFAGSLRVGQLGAMASLPTDRLVALGDCSTCRAVRSLCGRGVSMAGSSAAPHTGILNSHRQSTGSAYAGAFFA